jgi:hypothetical protein
MELSGGKYSTMPAVFAPYFMKNSRDAGGKID